MRFNFYREDGDEFHIVDHQQGSRAAPNKSLAIAVVWCPELAEKITKMLNDQPTLHKRKHDEN